MSSKTSYNGNPKKPTLFGQININTTIFRIWTSEVVLGGLFVLE